jgi:protein SCO1
MFSMRSLKGALVAMALLASCAGAAASATGYGKGGDFTLQGPKGPLSLSDLRGKVVLIFFGYTSCPDVCPISLARINASFSALTERERDSVRALFITLDPERDTIERLAKYTGYFNPNIIGLRDDTAGIDKVTKQYGVKYSRDPMPGSALGYSISHPADILLVDREGRLVDAVPHDSKPKYLLARIRELLNAPD